MAITFAYPVGNCQLLSISSGPGHWLLAPHLVLLIWVFCIFPAWRIVPL